MAKKDTRTRIVNTADRLFYTQGYCRTGVNQLIDEANVAKASFYSNFSSKKRLLEEYLEKRHKDWFENLDKVISKYDNPEEKILSLFEFLDEWIEETDYRGCAFININSEISDNDSNVAPIVKRHKQKLRDLICSLLTEHKNNNEAQENINTLSDTIYLLFEGAIVECQNYKEKWPIEQSLRAVQQIL